MNDDVIDIFSKLPINLDEFNHPPMPLPPKPKVPYTAFEVGEQAQINLKVTSSAGCTILLPYPYQSEVTLSPEKSLLDLVYHNSRSAMLLKGKHLEQLIAPLQNRTLHSIYAFSGYAHHEPSPEAVVITHAQLVPIQQYCAFLEKKQKDGDKMPAPINEKA